MFAEYDQYDGLGLAELIRSGEVSSAEVLDEMRERIATRNPAINAITQVYDDELQQAPVAGAPFSGLPMLVKDLNIYVAGKVTTNGSRFMQDRVAPRDSALVQRYRSAGLLIAGQTNSPEFGLAGTTEPLLNGPTHNPWRLGYSSGGSSGGAAAAVAAGIVPFAHASDGGGSIRIPSSACGLFGLKPSRGRISQAPYRGESWNGLSTDHAITRSVRDSAALLDASTGIYPGDPYTAPTPPDGGFLNACKASPKPLRIGFCVDNPVGLPVDEACQDAVRQTALLCESLGHVVEEARPDYDHVEMSMASYGVIAPNVLRSVEEREEALGRIATEDDLELITRQMIIAARQQNASDYVAAQRKIHQIGFQISAFWNDYDIYLTPTLGTPPQAHDELVLKSVEQFDDYGVIMATYTPFCSLANLTGQPSMSVPLHWTDDGLPVGCMFTGRYGDEATLLQLAAQLESAQPWFDRRPPVYW